MGQKAQPKRAEGIGRGRGVIPRRLRLLLEVTSPLDLCGKRGEVSWFVLFFFFSFFLKSVGHPHRPRIRR